MEIELNNPTPSKSTILVVDDSAMNRMVLSDMLGDDYEVIEAADGVEAVAELQRQANKISLILLDINMPKMSGIDVLNVMNTRRWIDSVPVIVISAERSGDIVSKAFDLGATDYIDRNFDTKIVKHRVNNAIMLYSRQRKLVGMVADQIYERERSNDLMISILSHIVEFRNQESGQHVQNIRILTELLLGDLSQKIDDVEIDQDYISLVGLASSLHDIGKIAIPEEILNKPGRLTPEEFEVIKTHPAIGSEMLDSLPGVQDEPLVRTAYEICRWHHERWDGRGYPDGLKGDEIPWSAQVVALADVYDALTSVRVYKDAIPSDKAVQMILNGECGTFNPVLLESFAAIADVLEATLHASEDGRFADRGNTRLQTEVAKSNELTTVDRAMQKLEHEQIKYQFYASMSNELHFEFTANPAMLMLQNYGDNALNFPEAILDPISSPEVHALFNSEDDLSFVRGKVYEATPEEPVISFETQMLINGDLRWVNVVMRVFYDADGSIDNIIGKIVDIHEKQLRMMRLAHSANYDSLTGLQRPENFFDLANAKLVNTDDPYELIMIDLDNFKNVNDKYGHKFGNVILQDVANRLRGALRSEDMVARIGGDEFLVFAQSKYGNDILMNRLKDAMDFWYEDLHVTASIGVAHTEIAGRNYNDMFHAADQALYAAKHDGKNCSRTYDEDMGDVLADAPTCIGTDVPVFED